MNIQLHYSVTDAKPIRTHPSTNSLHKTLENIDPTVRDQNFSREDPVWVLHFLTRVLQEADTLRMNEGQLIFLSFAHTHEELRTEVAVDFNSQPLRWIGSLAGRSSIPSPYVFHRESHSQIRRILEERPLSLEQG